MKPYLTTLLLSSLLFLACGHQASPEEQQIEEVAYNYCIATSNYNLDSAALFSTEEHTRTALATAKFLLQYVDSAYIASDAPATIEIKRVTVTSDTTAYAVYHKQTPIKDFVDTLDLCKENGRWLVYTPVENQKIR